MGLLRTAFKKVKESLARTRETFVGQVRSLRLGKKHDDALIDQLEATLVQADIGIETALELTAQVRRDFKSGEIDTGDQVLDYMKEHLKSLWPEQNRALRFASEGNTTVILVVCVNGVGKTTSVAKVAADLRRQGKSVLLAACDTYRAGAVRQLEIWSERLGVEIIKGKEGGDPAAVAYDACDAALARKVDVLLIDTAGRMHNDASLMRQLTKIHDITAKKIQGAPHETLLVLDATTGQNAVRQAEQFNDAIDLTGIFLSKLDGSAKGGVVIAVHKAVSVPVKLVGVGETPEDVEAFDPESFIEAMFAETDSVAS
ncbi:MAG: signal recognition particle-docking protein FtsY [Planctomycetota bacterium]